MEACSRSGVATGVGIAETITLFRWKHPYAKPLYHTLGPRSLNRIIDGSRPNLLSDSFHRQVNLQRLLNLSLHIRIVDVPIKPNEPILGDGPDLVS